MASSVASTPNRMSEIQIAGVVLAGGRGQRMGGIDKGLVLLDGRPLVVHVLERLAPQVDSVMINANRNHEFYARLGYPVFPDRVGDLLGPLAGLQAALRNSVLPSVLSVPCDAPFFPSDLAARLRRAVHASASRVAVARVANRIQPVFCLAHRDALPLLDDFLARGGRRFAEWLGEVDACEVDFDHPAAFDNLNTLADVAAADKASRHRQTSSA